MKKYREIKTSQIEIMSVVCDICKTEYTDESEIQEFLNIEFTGGYGSVFGDGDEIACDVCQHCLKIMLDNKWRTNENEKWICE